MPSAESCHISSSGAPEWLAGLLVNPPMWVWPALAGVACLVLAGALWGYRRWGFSDRTQVEIAANVWLVVATGVTARFLVVNGVDYPEAVVASIALGFGSSVVLRRFCFWPAVNAR